MVTAVNGTHPTGMHSCLNYDSPENLYILLATVFAFGLFPNLMALEEHREE